MYVKSKICPRCGGSSMAIRQEGNLQYPVPCPECKGRGYLNLTLVDKQELEKKGDHYGLEAFGEGNEL